MIAAVTDVRSERIDVADNPFSELNAVLGHNAHEFLRPTLALQQTVLQAAKSLLDPLATSIADAQNTRRIENRRKRKRNNGDEEEQVLQLRQIHTQGFGAKQVWEQAKRVLDAASIEVERQVTSQIDQQQLEEPPLDVVGETNPVAEAYVTEDDEDGMELGDDDDVLDDEDFEDEASLQQADKDGEEDIEADSDVEGFSDDGTEKKKPTYTQDPNGLNDGFFSIDDFNRQSQFLEQMDVRGDDDNPSDEDEVDWDADPLAMPLPHGQVSKPGRKGQQQEAVDSSDENDGDEEEGPTFGDADLDASTSEDEADADGEEDPDENMGLSNANDIKYADFFEPPPKKPSKTKRMRALPKTQPTARSLTSQGEDEIQDDIDRAMADVRRDLLDSEDEDDFEEEDDEEDDEIPIPRPAKPSDKNLSTHEKQQAEIAAEIRRLEAANVAKRDWQLSGEARAADRPLNSLIEEDLEFERAGKPVPVVTAETSEEIEELIKRRILAREFDEITRRLPDTTGNASETRRGRIELDDTKAQSGLADVYEQEHLRNSDPLAYVDKRSTATKKQHEQIDVIWREVNEQLNMLSNLHFKPKRVDIQMTTVEDKPRIAMEDARPVGDLEAGNGGMLAPQEIYKPGVDSKVGGDEIMVGKGGSSMNREEMTREEKLRRRRREKERSKKAQNNQTQIVLGKDGRKKKVINNTAAAAATVGGRKSKEQEKADIIADLKKGNVKVVGKDGDLQNLGKKKGAGEQMSSFGGNLKL